MTGRIITGSQVRVAVTDDSSIGECRRSAKRLAEGFGFDEVGAGRVTIIATELATNIVRHAKAGEVLIQVLDDGINPLLELLAIDQGPGMQDTDACLRDGYSTAGSAGQGLGAVARLSGSFDLFSLAGQGTVVWSRSPRTRDARGRPAVPDSPLELGIINLAVAGEIECGDTWRVADGGSQVSLFVADGLGHGPLAATAAQAAAQVFCARPFDAPSMTLRNCHGALAGTRGAAAACALLQVAELRLDYAGVGNIAGAVVTPDRSRGMVSHAGTLGAQLLRTLHFEYEWPLGSRVVMHSDGLSARWNIAAYPGLYLRHPAVIAGILYRDFVRRRDDVTLVIACHRQ
ncbi:MAG: ATP-binding protein/SpoIIE family protein phosphatase [Pseudomonadota bacterium]|nr:ATP-binding protein/SpoIIE family protein phosphatase [Pseudomonadota bacterium]